MHCSIFPFPMIFNGTSIIQPVSLSVLCSYVLHSICHSMCSSVNTVVLIVAAVRSLRIWYRINCPIFYSSLIPEPSVSEFTGITTSSQSSLPFLCSQKPDGPLGVLLLPQALRLCFLSRACTPGPRGRAGILWSPPAPHFYFLCVLSSSSTP